MSTFLPPNDLQYIIIHYFIQSDLFTVSGVHAADTQQHPPRDQQSEKPRPAAPAGNVLQPVERGGCQGLNERAPGFTL